MRDDIAPADAELFDQRLDALCEITDAPGLGRLCGLPVRREIDGGKPVFGLKIVDDRPKKLNRTAPAVQKKHVGSVITVLFIIQAYAAKGYLQERPPSSTSGIVRI